MNEYHGERLKVARLLLGLTQEQTSSVTGVSQAAISSLEHGVWSLAGEVAARLAAGLELPVEFFAVLPGVVAPSGLNFRKLAGSAVRATSQLAAQYGEAARIAESLLDRAQHPATALPVIDGYAAPQTIEEVAADLRSTMALKVDEPIRNLTRAVERLGVAVMPLQGLDTRWTGHDGVSGPWSRFAVVGSVQSDHGDRNRFSLAHEIGHLVLHSKRRGDSDRARETEAMRFAGALLLPEPTAAHEISESLSLNGYVRLKAKFGVSIAALVRRGFDLDLISQRRYRSLNVQMSSKGWRKAEPVEVGIERPALAWKLLTKLYSVGDPYDRFAPDIGAASRLLRVWIPERENTAPTGGRGRRLATVTPIRRAS